MKPATWLLVLLFVFSLACKAQYNSDYAQYMFNGLLINPAYAGSQGALNATALYRKQWLGMNGSPSNTSLSFHTPLKNKKLNIGAVIINDQFGVYKHTKTDLVYAYRIPVMKGNLSFALQAGLDTYSTNWDKITTQDPGDPNFVPYASRNINPDIGAGTYYHSQNFYLGLSLGNLITNGINPYFITTITSGCVLKLSDNFRIKPVALFKYINNSPASANLSSTFYYKDILGLGVGCTFKNSALIYTDVKINQQLNFGYAYTYMLSELNRYTHGSHEIMLRYLFCYKIQAASTRYF